MLRSFKIISFVCEERFTDILIAELSIIGFDSFLQNDNGFESSILVEEYDQRSIENILETLQIKDKVQYQVNEVMEKNWNAEWERKYKPVIVDDFCRIKASFHQSKDTYPIDITINPRMSFGTGHHDTTFLMIQNMIRLDHKNKRVLDAGCGTGILSILAEKLGAEKVVGFDIDHWAFENSNDNIHINNCSKIQIIKGSIENIPSFGRYDIIVANISLNVILSDLRSYCSILEPGGKMILSGFRSNDYDLINENAINNALLLSSRKIQNKWLSLVYEAPSN
jgi:ribosomal protein L11 methyltransferase